MQEPDESDTNSQLDHLKAEVHTLKNEVAHQRTLREIESELRSSKKSLKDTESATGRGSRSKDRMSESESFKREHSSLSQLKESMSDSSDVNSGRQLLLKKLLNAELGVGTVNRQVDLLKDSLRLLVRVDTN